MSLTHVTSLTIDQKDEETLPEEDKDKDKFRNSGNDIEYQWPKVRE